MSENTLMGTFYQTMDTKGRMSFPAKLREVIGSSFIITKGVDGCLYAYSNEEFQSKAEKLRSLPMSKARMLQRSFMGWASQVEADKQGRILIPQALRECAGLVKEIAVVGVTDRCEIWDKTRWESYNAAADEELAKALEEIDF